MIDYGSATYSDERRKGTINTRQYRAPEVLLGMEWDEESDIWGRGVHRHGAVHRRPALPERGCGAAR